MKRAIVVMILLSIASGLGLLVVAFKSMGVPFIALLITGILAILAALKYTMGKNPYGYAGFGDLFVLIFFGFVGVMGTYFCHVGRLSPITALPALSCGLLATAVLNINNIRDISSDKLAGKKSIPVQLGREKAVVYHWSLIIFALLASTLYVFINYHSAGQFLFLASAPLLIFNGLKVTHITESYKLDPFLKQMALSTLVFILLFGIGNLVF